MSREEGAPVSSGIIDVNDSNPANQLIQLVRRGISFSGNEKNCVFLNTHQTRFANISAISGLALPDDARAIGRVDWDADGDLDLWVSNRNAPQIRFMRNDFRNEHDWISLKLEGRTSNRDAIGARVEILAETGALNNAVASKSETPIVRTVRCGDGYLTQSSKTLHIGLGAAESVDIRVRWPSGIESTFSDVRPNEHYRIVEGTENVEMVHRNRIELTQPELMPTKSAIPVEQAETASAAFSVSSTVRPYLPRLPYQSTMSGSEPADRDVIDRKGTPILVVLWASWCPACKQELAELSAASESLRQTGLKILALRVDDLTADQNPTSIFSTTKFPFESGIATESLTNKLQLVNDYLFLFQRPFPVPMSFLIDPDFRLAAIYRGPIELARLRDDVHHLSSSTEIQRDRSVPFTGKWIGEPSSMPMLVLILELIQGGYLEDASELLQRIQSKFRKPAILELVVRLGVAYYKSGTIDRAEQHFQMARKIQPDTVGPEIELGQFHSSKNDHQRAREFYLRALKINPNSIPALNNLAWLLATSPDPNIKNGEQAVLFAQKAVTLTNGKLPRLLDTLATCYAETDRLSEAIKVSDQAISLAKRSSQFNLAGEIQRKRTRLQEKLNSK